MDFDRINADMELMCDLLIRRPHGDEAQDLTLALANL
jgi:hypothetical protein